MKLLQMGIDACAFCPMCNEDYGLEDHKCNHPDYPKEDNSIVINGKIDMFCTLDDIEIEEKKID